MSISRLSSTSGNGFTTSPGHTERTTDRPLTKLSETSYSNPKCPAGSSRLQLKPLTFALGRSSRLISRRSIQSHRSYYPNDTRSSIVPNGSIMNGNPKVHLYLTQFRSVANISLGQLARGCKLNVKSATVERQLPTLKVEGSSPSPASLWQGSSIGIMANEQGQSAMVKQQGSKPRVGGSIPSTRAFMRV